MSTPPASLLASGPDGWRYWRADAEADVEFAALRGRAPGLVPHFHEQDQITLVVAGRRWLRVGGDDIELTPGRCLWIPAGVPHASQPEPSDVLGLIAFLPAGAYLFEEVAADIERSWEPSSRTSLVDFAALLARHRRDVRATSPLAASDALSDEPIGRVAARGGVSREGFTRNFTRLRGIPPHAFRLSARLDRARRLLRAGGAVADVAAEMGFADQSHFGRAFKRTFGVSPGRYRQG